MRLLDIHAVIAIWKQTPGIVLREDDCYESIERYLTRNPELSFVACHSDELVGAILCGHDGRRGFLQHLAVVPARRQQGIGSALVQHALIALKHEGIQRAHVDVLTANPGGHSFWMKCGWSKRTDLVRYSLAISHCDFENAFRIVRSDYE